jgi:histone deacetylase 1/2
VKDYSGNILHRSPLSKELYNFSASLAHLQPQAFSSIRVSSQIWYRRLGHASFPVINKAISLPIPHKTRSICSDCQLANSHAIIPFINMHVTVSQPLELIYPDVWGPASTSSTSSACYYISFLDDAAKFLWLFPLKLKYDTYQTFLSFQTAVECQFDSKIKDFQSDWGGEYRNLNTYLHNQGINHRITCPYTHQQAVAIERRHRQIVEVGLTLLAHSNLPQMFWEDAFLTVIFIINRLSTLILNHKSPYEMVHHQKLDYNFLHTFGCACWPYLRPYNRHKLDFQSKDCIFIGYSIGHRGYKCLDFSTDRIFVSRHVVFDENLYPYTAPKPLNPSSNTTSVTLPSNLNLSSASSFFFAGATPPPTASNTLNMASSSGLPRDHCVDLISPEINITEPQNTDSPPQVLLPSASAPPTQNWHPMTTRSKNNIHKPKLPSDSHVKYPIPKALLATFQTPETEPTCYIEAVKNPN